MSKNHKFETLPKCSKILKAKVNNKVDSLILSLFQNKKNTELESATQIIPGGEIHVQNYK